MRLKNTIVGFLAGALMLTATIPAAHAALQRVGPINPANGYPAWYQDKTGLTLDSCTVLNQSELDGGWCLVLPGNIPGAPPEVFPANFSEEHFFWSAGADASVGTTRVLLVQALEGAFGGGPVAAGDQMVFARVRIVINPLPFSGDYTVYTPFGKFSFPAQVAGDRLFFTEDIGLAPGDFTQALSGRVGPFLLPSAVPGGAEMPPLTAANPTPDTDPANFGGVFGPTPYPGTGKSYIADPARIGPVTGSPLPPYVVGDGTTRDANLFRVEGPNGFVTETVGFALSGRLFEGAIAGQIGVRRASYARTATSRKVDVYATASPSTQARIPAGPVPAAVPTTLAYFDAACSVDALGNLGAPTGAVSHQMFANGSNYYGQSSPATLPLEICVQANAVNAAGQTVATHIPVPLGDQVFISEALYDSSSQSLSVKATSSDQVVAQALSVEGLGTIPATGQLVVTSLLAPPESVVVLSSGRGINQLQVSTGPVAGGVATLPVAINDTATTLEDTATTIAVLANDTSATGGTVALASAPLLGTAVVNANGTIAYTPRLNASGTDIFTYTVTVGTKVSNAASVTVTITPVNDAPVANPDSATAIANLATTLNVTSNDTDPDGAADIVAVTAVSPVTPAVGTLGTATAAASGKNVTFTATAAGIYSFTYRAVDAAGLQSNPTTVTVTVATAETIAIVRAEYVVSKGRLRAQGTIAPAAGQTVTVAFLNAVGSVLGTAGTAIADAAGNWAVDTAVALPTGASRIRATSSNGSVATATIALK